MTLEPSPTALVLKLISSVPLGSEYLTDVTVGARHPLVRTIRVNFI